MIKYKIAKGVENLLLDGANDGRMRAGVCVCPASLCAFQVGRAAYLQAAHMLGSLHEDGRATDFSFPIYLSFFTPCAFNRLGMDGSSTSS